MREVISTLEAPRSALYSQGIKAGGHVFVSGLVGIDVTTGQVAGVWSSRHPHLHPNDGIPCVTISWSISLELCQISQGGVPE